MSELPNNLEELQKLVEQHQRNMDRRDRAVNALVKAGPASIKLMKEGRASHPLAGKKARYLPTGEECTVEDWFEKLFGEPYLLRAMNVPVTVLYFCRMAIDMAVPIDNDVVFVKSRHGASSLVHASELAPVITGDADLADWQLENCRGCRYEDPGETGSGDPCCTKFSGPEVDTLTGFCLGRR